MTNYRLASLMALIMAFAAACQSGPPPTEILMEVTRVVTIVVTANPDAGPVPVASEAAQAQAEDTAEATETASAPAAQETPTPTPTPDVFPTPVVGRFFIAEQPFQNGTMFWLEPIDQIWVIARDAQGNQTWEIYEDTFEEGMIESDPTFEPPISGLVQPVRGFGLLWRENEAVRDDLGFATAEEIGYMANYQYHYGGTVDENNEFVQGPGYHLLETLSRDVYRFNEGTWTWELSEWEE